MTWLLMFFQMTLWEVPLLKPDHSHLNESQGTCACTCVCLCAWACKDWCSREISRTTGEKGFLLLFQNQSGGIRRSNHQSVCFCVLFPPPERERERQHYGLAVASTTGSANTKIIGQKIVWHVSPSSSVIKLPLKYTHKKPFDKLLSPPPPSLTF